jgi:hypothetical protein
MKENMVDQERRREGIRVLHLAASFLYCVNIQIKVEGLRWSVAW